MLPFSDTTAENNLEILCSQVTAWFARRNGVAWLVTKDHILIPNSERPHFAVACSVAGDLVKITITAQNTAVNFLCNKVVASPFRSGQIEFLIFNEEGIQLNRVAVASLASLYQQILTSFPPGSNFSSSELYEKVRKKDGTPQAHARRRWKELKYYYGFDVDFDVTQNKYIRGNSKTPVNNPVIRPDDAALANKFLKPLVEASKKENEDTLAHCAACNVRVAFKKDIENEEFDESYDDLGLLDHRRPVFQGGDDTAENLQIFCQTCNNRKNSICRKCPYQFRCDSCAWAFPEKFLDQRVVVHLNPELIKNLKNRFGADLEKALVEILADIKTD